MGNDSHTEEKAKLLLEEWQERLGLQAWRIKIVPNCKPEDMVLQSCTGCTEWSESVKTARIEIMDPMHYGDRIIPFDFEKTLIHELLHLKTCLISDGVPELQARYMHQIIDDLARALVDAKRSERGSRQAVMNARLMEAYFGNAPLPEKTQDVFSGEDEQGSGIEFSEKENDLKRTLRGRGQA